MSNLLDTCVYLTHFVITHTCVYLQITACTIKSDRAKKDVDISKLPQVCTHFWQAQNTPYQTQYTPLPSIIHTLTQHSIHTLTQHSKALEGMEALSVAYLVCTPADLQLQLVYHPACHYMYNNIYFFYHNTYFLSQYLYVFYHLLSFSFGISCFSECHVIFQIVARSVMSELTGQ